MIAKIESIDSLTNLEEIIIASDGAMVARGDLGAQIPLEQVPAAQQRIVKVCRALNKPVIVASQLLESMIEYPTPTRAEVADVSEAVRQRSDALMLSGESAMGQFPDKALTVLRSVSLRIERWWREEKRYESTPLQPIGSGFSDRISEEICNSAAKMGKFHVYFSSSKRQNSRLVSHVYDPNFCSKQPWSRRGFRLHKGRTHGVFSFPLSPRLPDLRFHDHNLGEKTVKPAMGTDPIPAKLLRGHGEQLEQNILVTEIKRYDQIR